MEPRTFAGLLAAVGSIGVALLSVLLLDVRLTLLALVPVVLATAGTLGALALLGRAMDFPGQILTLVVLGASAIWSLLAARSYQRHGAARHPALARVLRSLEGRPRTPPPAASLEERIRARYARLEPNARLFVRFKLKLDPLFRELAGRPIFAAPPRVLLDIGTGNGVPACWLAETFPGVHLYGIDPLAEGVRVAARALGESGTIVRGAAPDLPPSPMGADGAFMLDMLHYLDDAQLGLTLSRLRERLAAGAPLVIRAVMLPTRSCPWSWWADRLINNLRGLRTWFRPEEQLRAILAANGFETEGTVPSGTKGEMLWLYARRRA
ncbi:MAG TPA: class I SAM-dependent methyltransferase [bacterium]